MVALLAQRGNRGRGRHFGGTDAQARHTAGQRLLDKTGNPKAVQKLLGRASIQTTGDVYTDWDVGQLAESQLEAIGDD